MSFDLFVRWLHIVGACVLFGTGSGIAFFMVMAHRTRNPVVIAHTAGIVVLADLIFTATAVIAQPITGGILSYRIGWPLTEGWIAASLGLYVLTGLFWLPVVWLQVEMRKLAALAAESQAPLPGRYFLLYRIWFACGFPAFAAVMGIIWLMISKPAF
jgi:uncharacterized membrane protein